MRDLRFRDSGNERFPQINGKQLFNSFLLNSRAFLCGCWSFDLFAEKCDSPLLRGFGFLLAGI